MEILGRLVEASNATFLAEEDGRHVVYKPTAGEAPLWDFPPHTLGRREVAAHELSRAAGFDVVPRTRWLDEGPLGPGSVQDWVETDGDALADLFGLAEVPEDWFAIVVGVDDEEHEVALAHADHPGLRRLALFDVLANNADRKAGHVLRAGEHVWGVDHGVTFHTEPKLRTVLWGWSETTLTEAELALVRRALDVAEDALGPWLSGPEVAACQQRARHLLDTGILPSVGDDWRCIPWPPI